MLELRHATLALVFVAAITGCRSKVVILEGTHNQFAVEYIVPFNFTRDGEARLHDVAVVCDGEIVASFSSEEGVMLPPNKQVSVNQELLCQYFSSPEQTIHRHDHYADDSCLLEVFVRFREHRPAKWIASRRNAEYRKYASTLNCGSTWNQEGLEK